MWQNKTKDPNFLLDENEDCNMVVKSLNAVLFETAPMSAKFFKGRAKRIKLEEKNGFLTQTMI